MYWVVIKEHKSTLGDIERRVNLYRLLAFTSWQEASFRTKQIITESALEASCYSLCFRSRKEQTRERVARRRFRFGVSVRYVANRDMCITYENEMREQWKIFCVWYIECGYEETALFKANEVHHWRSAYHADRNPVGSTNARPWHTIWSLPSCDDRLTRNATVITK